MATDISVTINPPAQFDLNLQPPNEIDLTIKEGFPKHAETHAPGGSDSLAAYYATGLVVRPSETGNFVTASQTGFYTGVFYPYSSNPNGYVQGAVVRPSNTGGFLDSGSSQTINSLKNFLVRPTVNGTGVLLSGETPNSVNTGVLTGVFYPLNSNPSGYITGVDLSNYVTKSSTGIFVTTGQTGNFITTSQTGGFVSTGSTGSFITSSQTGQFVGTGQTGNFVTGSVVRPSETGSFITTSQTGQFVSTGSTGSFVTGAVVRPSETGAFITTGQTGVFITSSQTGQFVSTGSTGSFVTGSVVRPSETGNFITTLQTGQFVSTGATGNFVTGSVVRPSETGSFITSSQTGQFVGTGSTGSFVTGSVVRPSETGAFLTTGSTGNFITSSQTGQFVSTGATGSFVTGSVVRPSETGNFITASQTGQFVGTGATGGFAVNTQVVFITGNQDVSGIKNFYSRPTVNGTGVLLSGEGAGAANTGSLTGVFYPLNSNPSGYITGVDLSAYVTTGQTGQFVWTGATGSFVTTGQTGQFYPTSNPSGFLTSGSSIDLIHLYAKNDQGSTIYKGQPVYIGGANGANPLIKLASNTGEPTSSKTIGLLAQDLSVNQFGYIITEGVLEGFNTSAAAAGDPMWLGTGGNIIYGLANKPYGNNHLVYLGVVLRSNNNNGRVYVKPQNGFEIEELHRVYAKNASTNDTLMYNSGSGSWFARQINTGDVSGISAYALAANTGSFITTGQTGQFVSTGSTGSFVVSSATGAFLTTGAADGRYYGLANGQTVSGVAATGFNDAITGMTITGDTTKFITLFQRDGTTITGSFADNAGTGGGGGSGFVPVVSYSRWQITGGTGLTYSITGAQSSPSEAYRVTVNSVIQDTALYTINSSGDTISFLAAPPSGADIVVVETAISGTSGGGKIAQVVSTITSTTASTSVPIPQDNTIPQITEGAEVMTCSITPTNASSMLLVEATFWGSTNVLAALISAIFRDTTANAIVSTISVIASGDYANVITIKTMVSAGSTSATTFRLRIGTRSGVIAYFLSNSTGGFFSTSDTALMTITEILP